MNETIEGVWFLKKRFSNRVTFAYLDTDQNLADSVFIKHKVRLKFLTEMVKPGEVYKFVFAQCKRRDIENLKEALREIPKKMAICGHTDYLDKFREIEGQIKGTAETK